MNKDMFPPELASLKQWVCWRLEPDAKGGKDRKTPYCAATGRKASTTDFTTWTTLDDAIAAYGRGGYNGVGFVFTEATGVVGTDIDCCINPATGALNDVAAAILERVPPTFIEESQSGTGLHIYLRGTKPEGESRNAKTNVEMYATTRYFAATGKRWKDAPLTIAEDNGVLAWIHGMFIAKLPGKKKSKRREISVRLTDEELLDKARAAGDGEAFGALWAGEWEGAYGSQSEADMVMCQKLAFWSGKDTAQIDRLMRRTGLMRDKWDVRHHSSGATYGEETIARAIANTTAVYNPKGSPDIFVQDARYYCSKKDRVYPITNFLIEPLEWIVGEDEGQLTADLINFRGDRHRLAFLTNDLGSLIRFKNVLNRQTIELSFFGTENDLELLKDHLSSLSWERKIGVKALGIHEYGGRLVFVGPDGAVEAGGAEVNDIVQLERYRGISSEIMRYEPLDADELKELGPLLLGYNEPAKTVPVLGWTSGCFVKQHLHWARVKYPHLFKVGEAGSGKSNTLGHVIMPIFSRTKISAAPQVTAFTLMRDSASSNLIPQALDEFKPSKIRPNQRNALYNHFRDAYDGHEGMRGRANQTTEYYELMAPLVVAGEEAADETAIRERSVELLFSKKDLKSQKRRTAFSQLCARSNRLARFGRALLDTALLTGKDEVEQWHKTALEMFPAEYPDRVISNLACCDVGLCLLERLCGQYGLSWDDVFPLSRDACRDQLAFAAREYLLDGGTHNKTVVEQAMEIMSRMGLSQDVEYTFDTDGEVLCICLNQVYDMLTKYVKDHAVVTELLPYTQFKSQLKHCDFFISSNVLMRVGGQSRKVWTLHYGMLKDRCDVEGFGESGNDHW